MGLEKDTDVSFFLYIVQEVRFRGDFTQIMAKKLSCMCFFMEDVKFKAVLFLEQPQRPSLSLLHPPIKRVYVYFIYPQCHYDNVVFFSANSHT